MKNTRRIITSILVLCCIVLTALLSGCSAGTPDADRIKSDLNATEFINAAELYDYDETKTIPVTEVSIIDTTKEKDYCRMNCTVVQENENYRKESQLMISYNKLDDWYMDTYNATSANVVPLAGVPDDMIRNSSYISSLAGYRDDRLSDVECSSINHNFDSTALTDNVSVECIVTSETCKKVVKLSVDYKFSDHWRIDQKEQSTISREWLTDNLVGTTWAGSLGFGGVRTVRINSIDTTNQTMSLDYGYSSLTESEVCSYKIKDYNRYGEEKQALVMDLTYDFYDLEIIEEGIWFGANLSKITD